jgi:transposase
VFGLTPSRYQSGESETCVMPYEAAQSMLVRSAKWSWLKAWAMKIARHGGMNKRIVVPHLG